MWLYGDLLAATDPPAQTGVSDQLIITIGGVVTAAIAALAAVGVAMVNRGGGKTTPSPPSPTAALTGNDHELYERTAVLNKRADDSDERFDVIDKARAADRDDLDDVLDYLDAKDPGWR